MSSAFLIVNSSKKSTAFLSNGDISKNISIQLEALDSVQITWQD